MRWCIGCAVDTCGKCWGLHVPACFNKQENECYCCDEPISKFESIEEMDGLIIQGFTGRCFCSDECHDSYLVSEGLA